MNSSVQNDFKWLLLFFLSDLHLLAEINEEAATDFAILVELLPVPFVLLFFNQLSWLIKSLRTKPVGNHVYVHFGFHVLRYRTALVPIVYLFYSSL